MQIEEIDNGVIVIETSEALQVVKLIQQQANKAVSGFVERGTQPTLLPEGNKE